MDDINELIKKIIKGDKELYRYITKEYYRDIYYFIRRQVNNDEEAKDITQEVFVKAYLKLRQYNSNKASFKTWLYKIATNYCYDYFKSKQYRNEKDTSELDFEIEYNQNILSNLINQEQAQLIVQIMKETLNRKHFEIMMLHYFAEQDVNEIADSLHISNKTIYSAIDLSLKKIKTRLEDMVYE